jgi:DNA-binding MarR family transcriptional regulator
MEDFVTEIGLPLIAHRLRRLSEHLVESYAEWLPTSGVSAPARSLSLLTLISRDGPLPVTVIAARLKLSHPLIIGLVGKLEAEGLVVSLEDRGDRRRRPVSLTDRGREEVERLIRAMAVMAEAYRDLFKEAGVDLLDAVERIEAADRGEDFADRLRRVAGEFRQEEERLCVS